MNNFEKAGYPEWLSSLIIWLGYAFVALAAICCLLAVIYTISWWIITIQDNLRKRRIRKLNRERLLIYESARHGGMLTPNECRAQIKEELDKFGGIDHVGWTNYPQDI